MDYRVVAQGVLAALGGKENVASNMACMTRLRVRVKDTSLVNKEQLKATEGVLNVQLDGELAEVVFGPGVVNKVLAEFSQLTGLSLGTEEVSHDDVLRATADNKAAQKAKYDKPVQRFLKKIANIFVPLLPGIIAAGLINGISNIIGLQTKGSVNALWWYATIRTMGWALFLYLPVLVGMNSAKEFGGSGVLGAMAGALSIANAAMPLALKSADGAALVSLPFAIGGSAVYNAAAGGMLGALISAAFFAIIEKNLRKVMPNALDTFITPLVTVIVGSIVAVLVLQPLGALLQQGIYAGLNWVYNNLGIAGGYILSSTFLPIVSVGLHQALTPIHVMLNDPNGPTQGINYLLPILMMAGGGQVGAGFALWLKTKNKKLKKYVAESIPVGILGVGEPMMYAVTLPLGKPFITACLGAGFGGIAAVVFKLGTVTQGVSGLFGLLIVGAGQQLTYLIAMVVAYLAGFALTWFFGVDEERINDVFGK